MTEEHQKADTGRRGPPTLQPPLQGEWIVLPTPGHPPYVLDLAAAPDGRLLKAGRWRALLGRAEAATSWTWGRPVFAPAAGRVVSVGDGWPDRARFNVVVDGLRMAWFPPGPATDLRSRAGNHVIIEAREFAGWVGLFHLQDRRVCVRAGEDVVPGQLVGYIGLSGRSVLPHLHFQVTNGPDLRRSAYLPWSMEVYDRWESGRWRRVDGQAPRKGERVRFPLTKAAAPRGR